MSSWRWRSVTVIIIGTLLPNLSAAQSQSPAAPSGRPDLVSVAYAPPDNPSFQDVYDLLRQRNVLEKIKEMLSPFQFPQQLAVETAECRAVNAYYQRKNFKPTVTICYEFVKRTLELLPNETSPVGLTPADAVVGQFFWTTFHEVGHAAFDMFNVPLFAHEEMPLTTLQPTSCCSLAKARRGD